MALAEALMTSSAKGLMPREAIGSKALCEASSSDDPIAQYMVAVHLINGQNVMAAPQDGLAVDGARRSKRPSSGTAPTWHHV
jgi:hypothetical protein